MGATDDRISRVVREAIAACCALDAASLRDSTPLVEANMDSLTMVTVVCQVEIELGMAFTPDELAEIVRARDVGELESAVARKVGLAST
jgi:acyl carrier protein